MSTTQKRGFRLPWSSDPTPEDPSDAAGRLATFLEAAAEGHAADGHADTDRGTSEAVGAELGEGPFHVTPGETTQDVEQPVQGAAGESEAVVLESVVDGRADGSAAVENSGSKEPQERDGAETWPTADRPAEPPVATDEAVAATDEAAPAAHETAPAAHEPAPAVDEPARTPRRDNPLVVGLVKAMREAAEASRNETMEALHAEAQAQVEAVRTGATDEVAALRQQADDDIGEIREWAKSETARIKQESEQRIVDRREALEHDLETHALAIDARAAQVEQTVAAYEAEMESFFEQLLAETDPARLATLAEHAPEPPILSELPAIQDGATQRRAADDAAEPPEEPETDDTAIEPSDSPAQDSVAELSADAQSTDAAPEAPGHDTTEAAEALGPEAAAAAEAEAFEGLGVGDAPSDESRNGVTAADGEAPAQPAGPGRQRLVVTGLATVAGISAFKGALGRLSGVESVSVMAGDPGTFVFTVSHDGSTDVATMLPQLSDFEAHVTGGDDETLQVATREPAA